MNINPFTIRYRYHAALRYSGIRRKRFASGLSQMSWPGNFDTARQVPVTVLGLVGQSGLPEMVRCVGSFLRHVGTPKKFVILSDGSLTETQREMLCSASSAVQVVELQDLDRDRIPAVVWHRIPEQIMLLKVALLTALPGEGPWLYLDSDVEFFSGGSRLASDIEGWSNRPRFVKDTVAVFDDRMFRDAEESSPWVNAGFLFLPQSLDWTRAVARLRELEGTPIGPSEQSMIQMAMRDSDAAALDPSNYVLAIDDQFDWKDRYAHDKDVVCRHYVGTVRYKMWNRWALSP